MNAIVLAGVNPYKVARERFIFDIALNCPPKLADRINKNGVNMLDILPSLASKAGDVNTEENYLEQLEETWTSKLDEIGYEILNSLTQTFERDYISKEHGEFTWETLLDNSEDYLSDNLDIHLTGVFRQLFLNMHGLITSTLEHIPTKNLKIFPPIKKVAFHMNLLTW